MPKRPPAGLQLITLPRAPPQSPGQPPTKGRILNVGPLGALNVGPLGHQGPPWNALEGPLWGSKKLVFESTNPLWANHHRQSSFEYQCCSKDSRITQRSLEKPDIFNQRASKIDFNECNLEFLMICEMHDHATGLLFLLTIGPVQITLKTVPGRGPSDGAAKDILLSSGCPTGTQWESKWLARIERSSKARSHGSRWPCPVRPWGFLGPLEPDRGTQEPPGTSKLKAPRDFQGHRKQSGLSGGGGFKDLQGEPGICSGCFKGFRVPLHRTSGRWPMSVSDLEKMRFLISPGRTFIGLGSVPGLAVGFKELI